MQEQVHNWLSEKTKIAGVLACGIRAPDRKTFTRSLTPQFTQMALENACRCLSDTFQVLGSNRFPVRLVRWVYENYFFYGFMRPDGHCFALLTRRNAAQPALQQHDLETIVSEFHALET
jgi:hypothetical protein